MTTTQKAMPADDMDMRGILDDTMTKLGVKATPLAPSAPPAPAPHTPPKPPVTRQEQLIGAGIGLVLLLIASILWGRWQAAAASVPTLPPAPAALGPTPNPHPPSPEPEPAMLPAYAAPNGAELGQIEASRAITPTAHYGSDWIQADVSGSGRIWLRASDFPDLAIVGPDLAPKPTATARPYVPPTPEPQPPCLTAGSGAQVVTVCDWLSDEELRIAAAAKWVATYGGNPGIVTTPTPQEWNKP